MADDPQPLKLKAYTSLVRTYLSDGGRGTGMSQCLGGLVGDYIRVMEYVLALMSLYS